MLTWNHRQTKTTSWSASGRQPPKTVPTLIFEVFWSTEVQLKLVEPFYELFENDKQFRDLKERLFNAEERYKYAHTKEVELQAVADDLAVQYESEKKKFAQLKEN